MYNYVSINNSNIFLILRVKDRLYSRVSILIATSSSKLNDAVERPAVLARFKIERCVIKSAITD